MSKYEVGDIVKSIYNTQNGETLYMFEGKVLSIEQNEIDNDTSKEDPFFNFSWMSGLFPSKTIAYSYVIKTDIGDYLFVEDELELLMSRNEIEERVKYDFANRIIDIKAKIELCLDREQYDRVGKLHLEYNNLLSESTPKVNKIIEDYYKTLKN